MQARTHQGDLIIPEGGEFILENENLIVDGNVRISPGSSFTMRNATLIISSRFKAQYRIFAQDAEITIENSKICAPEKPQVWQRNGQPGPQWLVAEQIFNTDGSIVKISGSELHVRLIAKKGSIESNDSDISFLYWGTRSIVKAQNTRIGTIVLDFEEGQPEDLVIEGLRTGLIEELDMRTVEGGVLQLSSSEVVQPWSANFMVSTKKNVTFLRSNIAIWCKIPPTKERIEIFNLPPPGYVVDFNLQKHISGITMPYNVYIKDSTQGGVKIELMKTIALVRDSHVMFHTHGDGNDAIVRNCTVYKPFNYGSDLVIFEDCTIIGEIKFMYEEGPKRIVNGEEVGRGGTFSVIYQNTIMQTTFIEIACDSGNISGTVEITSLSPEGINWISGVIERFYPIKVQSTNGTPLSNASWRLFDKDGNLVDEGTTDAQGEDTLSITFTKDNFRELWTLDVVVNGTSISTQISFVSSTPVLLSASQP